MAFKLSNTVLNEIYSIEVFMVRGKSVYLHESLTQELVESSPALSVYSREHFLNICTIRISRVTLSGFIKPFSD